MIQIKAPKYCTQEIHYIIEIVFKEIFKVKYNIMYCECNHIELSFENIDKKIKINTDFFKNALENWLQLESLPNKKITNYEITEHKIIEKIQQTKIPILYGKPQIKNTENLIEIQFDIFGTCFFMLSRYEEAIIQQKDKYNRFSAANSTAFRHNFLDRPIVNEYFEILYFYIKLINSDFKKDERKFKIQVSADVDFPFDIIGKSPIKLIKRVGGRLFRDNNFMLACCDILNYIGIFFNNCYFDSFYQNIFWMIKLKKVKNFDLAFYFIPNQTSKKYDTELSFSNIKVENMLRKIQKEDIEIGFHPGFETYNNESEFQNSANIFFKMMKKLNFKQLKYGGRQHFLRYDITKTPLLWEKNNFSYDSSLGYPEKLGFRCGICYEFSMYDITNRKKMNLKQRPLIVMDETIFCENYENLGFSTLGLEKILNLKQICQQYQGQFILLWHNFNFGNRKSKKFFKKIIK